MISRLSFSLTILLLLFSVGTLSAEPSAATKYLIAEPLSMMDWGCYCIEQHIEKHIDSVIKDGLTKIASNETDNKRIKIILETNIHSLVNVEYDYNTNVINIRIEFIDPAYLSDEAKKISFDKSQIKIIFETTNRTVKFLLGIDSKTGKPIFGSNASFLYSFFSHNGFKSKYETDKTWSELDNLTKISVEYKKIDGSTVECESPLTGTKLLCVD